MTEKTEIIAGGVLAICALCISVFYGFQYTMRKQNVQVSPVQTSQNVEKNITLAQLQTHQSQSDCWIVVSGKVYNVTTYLDRHPGGAYRIIPYCGSPDATNAFLTKGGEGIHSSIATEELRTVFVGSL